MRRDNQLAKDCNQFTLSAHDNYINSSDISSDLAMTDHVHSHFLKIIIIR